MTSDRPAVDVVVVNYNGGRDLAWSVEGLLGTEPQAVRSVLVVDNASRDGSPETLPRDPRLSLLALPDNRGFGAAANRGAREGDSELLLVLNPDCRIEPDSLRLLVAAFDAPEVAAAGPRIRSPDGLPELSWDRDLTVWSEFRRSRLWRSALAGDERALRRVRELVAESRTVDWVTGACLLLRRSAFEEVGGFDERFFLYFEDADLCRRLRAQDWAVRHVAEARAVHHRGGAAAPPEQVKRAYRRSHRLYYDRYRPWHERALIRWLHRIR